MGLRESRRKGVDQLVFVVSVSIVLCNVLHSSSIQPYSVCNLVIFSSIHCELSSQTDSGRNRHVDRCQTKFEGMDTPRMTPDPE